MVGNMGKPLGLIFLRKRTRFHLIAQDSSTRGWEMVNFGGPHNTYWVNKCFEDNGVKEMSNDEVEQFLALELL
jgi:hypothetical protein